MTWAALLCYAGWIKSRLMGIIGVVRNFVRMVALAALAASAIPATAQGTSDSYKFLKAVREGKGEVVDEMVSTPGFQINTKERATGDGALHILAARRNLNWMNFLIGKGARPDLQNQLGMTPLAIAAQ